MEANTQNKDVNEYNLPYEQILEKVAMMTTPNSELIKEAGAFFKIYTKGVFSAATLFKIILECEKAELRNMAAVFLKKSLLLNYDKFDDNEKLWVKRTVLERFFIEPISNVRNALGHVAGLLTKLVFEKEGSWNDLLMAIQTKTVKEETIQNRVLGTKLLKLTLDTSCLFIKDHLKKLAQF